MSALTVNSISGNSSNGSGGMVEYEDIKHTFFHNIMQTIQSTNGAVNERFGYSSCISIDGNVAVIGALLGTVSGITCGKAYVFKRLSNYWTQVASLSPTDSDLTITSGFGVSVAISPDANYIAVGARSAKNTLNVATGMVYIYKLVSSTWTFQQKIEPLDNNLPVSSSGMNFGQSVSLSNNILAVGAYRATASGMIDAGKVYLYNRKSAGVSGLTIGSSTVANWNQITSISASDASVSLYFGVSVAIAGNESYCFVGAYGDSSVFSNAGAAYVFSRSGNTWTQLVKLTASNSAASFNLGYSIACSFDGNYCVVGAYGGRNSVGPATSGSAHVFYYNGTTFAESDILVGSDRSSSDQFGSSVAMSADADYIAVGSLNSTVSALAGAGAVYVYKRLGTGSTNYAASTVQMQKMISSTPTASETFGASVGLSGNGLYLISGTNYSSTAGSSYIYKADNYFPLRTTSILKSATTTGTITMNEWNNALILGTLSGAITIVLPTNVIDGRIVNIIITNANGLGISFSPAIIGWTNTTTSAAYKSFRCIYNAGFVTVTTTPDNSWYVL